MVLVAHSKGGLIGKQVLLERTMAQTDDGLALKLLGLVAVATPFNGSRYASWASSRTLREFRPGSAIVRALAAEEQVNARIVSILPRFDPHIPGDRSLPGASERLLQSTGHFRAMTSTEGVQAIISGIESLRELND